jgi:hypothetical protein
MKRALPYMVLSALLVSAVQAQSWAKKDKEPEKTKGWLDNFEQAKKEAAAFKQPILAFFTCSNAIGGPNLWMREELLDTKAFKDFATENLILFEADFPIEENKCPLVTIRTKTLKKAVKMQNMKLAQQYGVDKRHPHLAFLLDADGNSLGKTCLGHRIDAYGIGEYYRKGDAETYMKNLKELLEQAGFKTVGKAETGKALSTYEKMKAQKAAEVAQAEEKK